MIYKVKKKNFDRYKNIPTFRTVCVLMSINFKLEGV